MFNFLKPICLSKNLHFKNFKYAIVCHNPPRNMPVDAHEILFGYKHILTNWEAMGVVTIATCSPTKKLKTSDFSGTEYAFQSIKCPSKNAFWKKGSKFMFKYFTSMCCTSDSIVKIFFWW